MKTDAGWQARIRSLKLGFTLALKGLKAASRNREANRFYRFYALAFSLLSLGLFSISAYVLYIYLLPAEHDAWYLQVGLWLLLIIGILSSLLLSPLLAVFTLNAGVPLFQERLLFSALEPEIPKRTSWLLQQEGLPLYLSILHSLRRLSSLVILFLLSFCLSLIPVLGPILAFGVQLYFSAPLLSSELLEPYFEKLGFQFQEQRLASLRYVDELRGFGIFCLALLSIPLIGGLFIGVLQAAAAQLVLELYEREAASAERSLEVEA